MITHIEYVMNSLRDSIDFRFDLTEKQLEELILTLNHVLYDFNKILVELNDLDEYKDMKMLQTLKNIKEIIGDNNAN